MTNPCSAFSSGSLCSGEAAGGMSRGRGAGSPTPERRSPDGGASEGHGSVGSEGHGSPGSEGHGSPGREGHGSPGSEGHGSPGREGHGSPGSEGHGSPGSEGHGSPGREGHGSPGREGHGSPGREGHGSVGSEGHGSPGREGHGSVGREGHGSPGREGHGSPGREGHGSPGSLRYSPFSADGRIPGPVRLDIDTAFQAVRQQEKEDIKVLNNQFVTLIEKVQSLEQQNKILTTRWNFLKDQDNSHSDSDIKAIYEQYMSKMNQEMKALNYEQENLESELAKVLSTMDTFRSKYEDEIRLCSGMEFTFMELKKDLDVSTLHRTELEVKLKGLQELLELKKTIYEQELEELLMEIKDISVVLGMDSCSRPDLGRIVEDVRAQYEALALRSWEEAEALTRRKLTDSSSQPGSFGGHLLDSRREIADLNIRIQKLRSCIVSQRSQCLYLEEHIREAGEQGEGTLRDARAKVAGLQEALQRSREHVAHLVREYQELMNIKLALDVEILTYRKLMEGEENSMEQPIPTIISAVHSRPKPLSASTLRNSRLFARVEPGGGGTRSSPQDGPGAPGTGTRPKPGPGSPGECS